MKNYQKTGFNRRKKTAVSARKRFTFKRQKDQSLKKQGEKKLEISKEHENLKFFELNKRLEEMGLISILWKTMTFI